MLKVTALGDNLKRMRRREGLTQEELAEKAGVGLATVNRVETGEIEEPRISTLRKLARALGVEVRDLLPED